MRVALLLALAGLPPAYAAFVAGWQLVSFTGFAVRLDEALPGDAWAQIALPAAQFVIIPIALHASARAAVARRTMFAIAGLAVAWAAAAPLLLAVASLG